jgi:phosphosulfolactate phosphohydrolase-like enzyme
VIVACSGERGARSLEDEVCAGLLAGRILAAAPDATTGAEAAEAMRQARQYGKDLSRLAHDSRWARHLVAHGRAADVRACLTLDAFTLVPVYCAEFDKVVSTYR